MATKWDVDTVKDVLTKNPGGMVLMYWDECGHCKGTIEKIKSKYGINPSGATAYPKQRVALVERRMIKDGTVRGFPTVFTMGPNGTLNTSHDTNPVLQRFGLPAAGR